MINYKIIQSAKVKELGVAAAFTGLAVTLPLVLHLAFGPAAGKLFLPMHVFVFLAGLALGAKEGLAVGVLTALISFSLTGMPAAAVLPFITAELAGYGFMAGLLKNDLKQNVGIALAGAMVFGRLVSGLALLILPTKLATGAYLIETLKAGWPGIVLQIILVPLAYKMMKKYFFHGKI